MKNIQFYGAAGEVTGSNYLLTAADGNQVLVDYGMFQGTEDQVKQNYLEFPYDPAALQGVFLTHAHLDHSGRLPLLEYGNFNGKVYMTEPTRALVEVILSDSARIAENDKTKRPLYTSKEVYKILNKISLVTYDKEITVGSFAVTFRDAGHILGSSSIEIVDMSSDAKEKIVFSGDLGNTPQDIVRPTQLIETADYVVMETTYGDKNHPNEDPMKILQEEINIVEESGGVLLIPSFALERTQEVLHMLHLLKKEKKIKVDTLIYLDSPMGITATQIYLDFDAYWNEPLKNYRENPFTFPGLEIIEDGRDSRAIIKDTRPKVIVAGSGMMSGGRIMHHAKNYLSLASTRVLFVGYQAEETIGREIQEGAKNVKIKEEIIKVNAHLRSVETLSSHADQNKLMNWLGHIKNVKKVFLTHGEQMQREVFAERIKNELSIKDVILPLMNETHELS